MAKTEKASFQVRSLDMNGMGGRMVVLPATADTTSEIFFVYDRCSSLEQWSALLEYLRRFGTVTAPDLPGFGGMASFYTINVRPNINNYADYLAAFFKLRFRRKQVVIVGVGFGMVVVTRMLQRYPHLAKHVRQVVSIGGYTSCGDLRPARRRYWVQRVMYRTGSLWIPAFIVCRLYFNRFMLPRLIARSPGAVRITDSEERLAYITAEITTWRNNDFRTRMFVNSELLTFDNCGKRLTLPLWHVVPGGQDAHTQHEIEQRLRVIFEEVTCFETTVTEQQLGELTTSTASKLIPPRLRQLLRKSLHNAS